MNNHSDEYIDDDEDYEHKLEPTSSQESEIPSKPIDNIDRNGIVIDYDDESFLSDEDGDDEALRQERL